MRQDRPTRQREHYIAMNLTSLLVDTHAHLCSAEFAHDLADVLCRAQHAGVGAVIAVGETIEDADRTLALANFHPMIRPAAGLYPDRPRP